VGAAAGLRSFPFNPLPAPAEVFFVESARGVRLRVAAWPLRGRSPRGTVLLLQGRGDLIEKYFEVVGALLARGFSVLTLDWRGQGGSGRELDDPLKSHVDDFALYRTDLDAVLAARPRGRAWGGPLLALAHSMGAAVLLQALAEGFAVDRAVVTAPMIALAPALNPPFAGTISATLNRLGFGEAYVPRAPQTRRRQIDAFPSNVLTSDREQYDRLVALVQACPDLVLTDPTIGWVNAAFAAMARLRRSGVAERISVPVLAAAGVADRVTDTQATQALVNRLPAGQMLTLPDARHEVMFERAEIRSRFWTAFDDFVLPAAGSRRPQLAALR
jgi:lysophospholipase